MLLTPALRRQRQKYLIVSFGPATYGDNVFKIIIIINRHYNCGIERALLTSVLHSRACVCSRVCTWTDALPLTPEFMHKIKL